MKTIRNISVIVVSALLALTACVKEEPVTVEFKEQTYQLNVGETKELATEVVVSNSDKKPSFSSSDINVAAVDANGLVTALAAGEVTLTASLEGATATCLIQVSEVKADSIAVIFPEILPADGTWGTLRAEVSPAGYDMNNLEWTFAPSADNVVFEQEKVSASEYRVRFTSFVEGGKLSVTVSDRNSELASTVTIGLVDKIIPATSVSLVMPDKLTAGEGLWATIKAEVTPAEYNADLLDWKFEPSTDKLSFKAEKVSSLEYKVSFAAYVSGASLEVIVTDKVSNVMSQGRIKVLERPKEGLMKLTLSPSALTLNTKSEPVTLNPVYEPDDYDKALLEWSSSNGKVATVAEGVVTVKAEGTADIRIKDKISGKEAVCSITVTAPGASAVVDRIELNETHISMRVGEESVQLKAKCYDEADKLIDNYTDLVWSAEPMIGQNDAEIEVVEVSQHGIVTPKNAGTTQIVVTDKTRTYVKATCNVTVNSAEVKVEEVRLTPTSKVIRKGERFTLEARVVPDDAENKSLTFKSSDLGVATVTTDGVVTGVKAGKATVTVTSSNGKYAECEVVVAEDVWVELSENEISLYEGGEKQLTAAVYPETAQDKTISWESSDKTVATVSNGLVKAVKEGSAIIKATSGGFTAECKVNVMAGNVDFDITIESADSKIYETGLMQDKSVKLNAYYRRSEDQKEYVPVSTGWKSSDETIATVDSEGNVTAVIPYIAESGIEKGKQVTITHIADHKQESVTIVVIKALPEQVVMTVVPEVDGQSYTMMHGDTFEFKAEVLPAKANQDVWYSISADASISNPRYPVLQHRGPYTADVIGKLEFTAYAADDMLNGNKATAVFTVTVLPVPLESLSVVGDAVRELAVGDEDYLSVSFTPENASYRTVTWTAVPEGIVSVGPDGKVTALQAGMVQVTGTVPEEGKSVTYDITVSEPVAGISVGDYYYSDGTTSSEYDATKTVVGVVFSTQNPTIQDPGLAGTSYVNGFAVALHDAATNIRWQESNSRVSTDLCVLDRYCGYSNTEILLEYNKTAAESNIINVLTDLPSEKPAANTTSWYVPSYAELLLIKQNLAALQTKIEEAGGTSLYDTWNVQEEVTTKRAYWSSTENITTDSQAYAVHMSSYAVTSTENNQYVENQNKVENKYNRVRYIFAF